MAFQVLKFKQKQQNNVKVIKEALKDMKKFQELVDFNVRCDNRHGKCNVFSYNYKDLHNQKKPPFCNYCYQTLDKLKLQEGPGIFLCHKGDFMCCWKCAVDPNKDVNRIENTKKDGKESMLPKKQEIVKFSKYPLRIAENRKNWVCFSDRYEQVNPKIGLEWHGCLSGITSKLSKDKVQDIAKWEDTLCFSSHYSEFDMCVKCLLKWKTYKFEEKEDYIELSNFKNEMLHKYVETPMKVEKQLTATQDKHKKDSLLEDIYKKFVDKNIKQGIVQRDLRINAYLPPNATKEEKQLWPFESAENSRLDLDLINTQYTYYNQTQFAIVRTLETVTFLNKTKYTVKTLRIHDESNNFDLTQIIMTESLPFQPKVKIPAEGDNKNLAVDEDFYPQHLPSVQFSGHCIYYFKRIYENVNNTLVNLQEQEVKPKSHLHLYRYNLDTKIESMVSDYTIPEKEYFLNPTFCKNFGQQFMVFSTNPRSNQLVFETLAQAEKVVNRDMEETQDTGIVVNLYQQSLAYEVEEENQQDNKEQKKGQDNKQRDWAEKLKGLAKELRFLTLRPQDTDLASQEKELKKREEMQKKSDQQTKKQNDKRQKNQNENLEPVQEEKMGISLTLIEQKHLEIQHFMLQRYTKEDDEEAADIKKDEKKEIRRGSVTTVNSRRDSEKTGYMRNIQQQEDQNKPKLDLFEKPDKYKAFEQRVQIFQMTNFATNPELNGQDSEDNENDDNDKKIFCYWTPLADFAVQDDSQGSFVHFFAKMIDIKKVAFEDLDSYPSLDSAKGTALDVQNRESLDNQFFRRFTFIFEDEQRYQWTIDQMAQSQQGGKNKQEKKMNYEQWLFSPNDKTIYDSPNLLRVGELPKLGEDYQRNIQSMRISKVELPQLKGEECNYTQYFHYNKELREVVLVFPIFERGQFIQENYSSKKSSADTFIRDLIKKNLRKLSDNQTINTIPITTNLKHINYNYAFSFRVMDSIEKMMKQLNVPNVSIQSHQNLHVVQEPFNATFFIEDFHQNLIKVVTFYNKNTWVKVHKITPECFDNLNEKPFIINDDFIKHMNNPKLCKRQTAILEQIYKKQDKIQLNKTFHDVFLTFPKEEKDSKIWNGSKKLDKRSSNSYFIQSPLDGFYMQIPKMADNLKPKDNVVIVLVKTQMFKGYYLFVFKVRDCFIFVQKTFEQLGFEDNFDMLGEQKGKTSFKRSKLMKEKEEITAQMREVQGKLVPILDKDTQVAIPMHADGQLNFTLLFMELKEFLDKSDEEVKNDHSRVRLIFEQVEHSNQIEETQELKGGEEDFMAMVIYELGLSEQSELQQMALVFLDIQIGEIRALSLMEDEKNIGFIDVEKTRLCRASRKHKIQEQIGQEKFVTKYQVLLKMNIGVLQLISCCLIETKENKRDLFSRKENLSVGKVTAHAQMIGKRLLMLTEKIDQSLIGKKQEDEKQEERQYQLIPLYGIVNDKLLQLQKNRTDEMEKSHTTIKGTQLLIAENKAFMVLNFIDSNFDAGSFDIESDMMRLDIRQVFPVIDIDPEESNSILVASVELRSRFAYNHMFDNFETSSMINSMLNSLLEMVPYRFSDHILLELNQQFNFSNVTQKQQAFGGQTMIDLYLHQPQYIKNNLERESIEEKDEASEFRAKPFFTQFVNKIKDKKLLQNLLNIGFSKGIENFMSPDFNLENSLYKAYTHKHFKTADLFLEKIFNDNNQQIYQADLMMTLEEILKQSQLNPKMIEFFSLSEDVLQGNQSHCSLEQKLVDSRLPETSDKQLEQIKLMRQFHLQNHKKQISNVLLKKNNDPSFDIKKLTNMTLVEIGRKHENEKEEKYVNQNSISIKRKNFKKSNKDSLYQYQKETLVVYESKEEFDKQIEEKTNKQVKLIKEVEKFKVEYTVMDFRYYILNQKLKIIRMGKTGKNSMSYQFDNSELAKIMESISQHQELFETETVQKIIDYQYKQTRVYFTTLFYLYFFLYYVPFLLQIFVYNKNFEIVSCVFCSIMMIYFFFVEMSQLQQQGRIQYLFGEGGIWNFFEIGQCIIYAVYFVHRLNQGFGELNFDENKNLKFFEIILQFLGCVFGFIKFLLLCRVFKMYSFLIYMMKESIAGVISFSVFFLSTVCCFTLLNLLLAIENKEGYNGLIPIIQLFLSTQRNSIGDVQIPEYTAWDVSKLSKTLGQDAKYSETIKSQMVISLIWLNWFLTQIINFIILLNLLIAVISQVYETVVSTHKKVQYTLKANLNNEFYHLKKFVKRLDELKFLVITQDTQLHQEEEKSFGIVQQLRSYIQKEVATFNKSVAKVHSKFEHKINQRQDKNLKSLYEQKISQRVISNDLRKVQKLYEDIRQNSDDIYGDLDKYKKLQETVLKVEQHLKEQKNTVQQVIQGQNQVKGTKDKQEDPSNKETKKDSTSKQGSSKTSKLGNESENPEEKAGSEEEEVEKISNKIQFDYGSEQESSQKSSSSSKESEYDQKDGFGYFDLSQELRYDERNMLPDMNSIEYMALRKSIIAFEE